MPHPQAQADTDPNRAADAAARAEADRRRNAVGFSQSIYGGADMTAQPSIARKMLFGQG